MQRHFERLAIVNRGEAAMRLIRAVREYNLMYGLSIRTISDLGKTPLSPCHLWSLAERETWWS